MLQKTPSMQDNSAVGIRATIARLNSMLQAHDPELWAHLEEKNKVIAHMPSTCMWAAYIVMWCFKHLAKAPAAGQPTVLCFPLDHSAADTRVPVSRCCEALGQFVQRPRRSHGLLAAVLHCHAVKHSRRTFAGWLFPKYQNFAELPSSWCSRYHTSSHAIETSKLLILTAVSQFDLSVVLILKHVLPVARS